MTRDEGEEIGRARQGLRKDTSDRFFDDASEEHVIGARGEVAFGRRYNLPVDRSLKPRGDRGIDFVVDIKGVRTTINVKTYRQPYNLLLKLDEVPDCADILVLAKHYLDKSVSFLGWTTREVILSCPVKDFGYGIINHYIPRGELRPMRELSILLGQ